MLKRGTMAVVVALALRRGGVGADDAGRPAAGDVARRRRSSRRPMTNGDTRKATTTADGDTGLWFVPTGEILPARSGPSASTG